MEVSEVKTRDAKTISTFASELEDFENIPCSLNYVAVCIAMPFFNGQINALLTAAFTLHFLDMGWPVVRCGLANSLGFALRMITQQILLRTGYWMAVPLCIVNWVFAILAIFFYEHEWAVFGQIIVIYGIDAAVAIEGISFDTFGDSEIKARKAASTTLSTFTMSVALSCSIGGILYDTLGWVGLAGYHTLCQGILILLLCLQGACRQSFMMNFFGAKDLGKETDDHPGDLVFVRVMPEGPGSLEAPPLPGAPQYMEVLDVDVDPEDQEIQRHEIRQSLQSGVPEAQSGQRVSRGRLESRASQDGGRSRFSSDAHDSGRSRLSSDDQTGRSRVSSASKDGGRDCLGSASPVGGRGRLGSAPEDYPVGGRGRLASAPEDWEVRNVESAMSHGLSHRLSKGHQVSNRQSGASRRSRGSNIFGSRISGRGSLSSGASRGSKLTQVSRLSESAQVLSYNFRSNNALASGIVGATGALAMPRFNEEAIRAMTNRDPQPSSTVMPQPSEPPPKAGIPKDIRFPAFLILMSAFFNNLTYSLEFATFAIFFREVHHWDQATWASLAQTSGDVLAAITIQVLSGFSEMSYDEAEAGCCRRFLHYLTSSPYNLSFLLVGWVLLNLGMISPVLPVAIAAQVVMGTTYVYSMKWTNDLNLFYSLGEPQVFMSLQVMTKNAEALGGSVAVLVGIALYTWEPWAPFVLCACLGCLAFIVYTVGFCSRLGLVEDIELAEASRARRRGIGRVTSWKSERS